jgi:hypothetical protein
MKQTQLLLGLTFLCFSLVTSGQTAQKSTVKGSGWKVLNETSYSIQYPDSWEINKSGQMGSSFFIISKLTSPQDKFRENVNLMIESLQGQKINLDKYVAISEGQLKTVITNGNIIESKRVKSNGHEFHKIIFTGDQGVFKLRFTQYYWVLNGQAYVLTFTCERTQFDNYKLTGERILNSFRIK